MGWEFETDPEWQAQLDWVRNFVETEVEPLTLLWPNLHHTPPPPWLKAVIDPLKAEVRRRGLWACHLGPQLGGKGYGQVKLALLNEILGRQEWAPTIFGTQGPDTGNAEILAHYGTPEQKQQYLEPLLNGDVFSCFAMTEPHAGSDPREFRTRAVADEDDWIIDGEKFFSSNVHEAAFLIVMAVTDPDVDPVRGMSMFLVPADTAGIEILRPTVTLGERPEEGAMLHPHLRLSGVRVPGESLLGDQGNAFVVAQTRLGGGRVHHSMRAVGTAQWAMDMMCERALSRRAQGTLIAEKQLVQQADCRVVDADPRAAPAGPADRLGDRPGHRARRPCGGTRSGGRDQESRSEGGARCGRACRPRPWCARRQRRDAARPDVAGRPAIRDLGWPHRSARHDAGAPDPEGLLGRTVTVADRVAARQSRDSSPTLRNGAG